MRLEGLKPTIMKGEVHPSTCHKAASNVAKSSDYSILRLIYFLAIFVVLLTAIVTIFVVIIKLSILNNQNTLFAKLKLLFSRSCFALYYIKYEHIMHDDIARFVTASVYGQDYTL